MKHGLFIWLVALGLAVSVGAAGGFAARKPPRAGEISMASLLDNMTNLAGMGEFPSPAYTCRQFSSYDRKSTSPTNAATWFANDDAGNFLRVEKREGRTEAVMMDAQGPGAIVRIWSANPRGTLRVYLDGVEKPVIEAPMKTLLDGTYLGLPRPIAGEYGNGWNLYLPIPYAKSCKVTSEEGSGLFYHFNYLTYPAGTKVVSFANDQIALLDAELKALASALNAPGALNAPPAGAAPKPFEVVVEPGGVARVIGTFTGPAAVRRFRLAWTPSLGRDEPALRAAVLEMTFDGETTVTAPLGDFFGTGPGLNPYESLPLSVARDGMMECRWVMPFKKSAEIRVFNYGEKAVSLKGEIITAPYVWRASSMHFHAKWRIEHDIPTRPPIDWNYMTATGKGVFAGVAFGIDNPAGDWWGEGDEKIYVDGETFPSHFGTGTEDYYGYAWASTGLFTHAYHNQTRCDGPGNAGRTSVNRFHIVDRIPFTKDFRFDMELWHSKQCKVNMAVMNYWYAMPGATDGFKPIESSSLILR